MFKPQLPKPQDLPKTQSLTPSIFEVFAGPPQPGVEHSGTWCGAEVAEGPGASDLGSRVQGSGNIILGLNRWEGGGIRLEILCPLLGIFRVRVFSSRFVVLQFGF